MVKKLAWTERNWHWSSPQRGKRVKRQQWLLWMTFIDLNTLRSLQVITFLCNWMKDEQWLTQEEPTHHLFSHFCNLRETSAISCVFALWRCLGGQKIVCITKEMNKGARRCYKVCVFRALQMTKSIFTPDWFVWTGEIATNWNLVRNNWTETIFPNVFLFTVAQSKSKKKTTMLRDSRCVILAWVESTGRAAWFAVSHGGPDEASRMKKAALLNNFVYKTSVGIWFISLYLSFGLG